MKPLLLAILWTWRGQLLVKLFVRPATLAAGLVTAACWASSTWPTQRALFGAAHIDIVALYHGAEADPITAAVPWFFGIDDITVVVHLDFDLLLDRLVWLVRLLRAPRPFLGRDLTAAYSTLAARSGRDHPRGWPLGSLAQLTRLGRDRRVSGRAGPSRSLHRKNDRRLLTSCLSARDGPTGSCRLGFGNRCGHRSVSSRRLSGVSCGRLQSLLFLPCLPLAKVARRR